MLDSELDAGRRLARELKQSENELGRIADQVLQGGGDPALRYFARLIGAEYEDLLRLSQEATDANAA